jgi:hypothetical protein
MNLQKMIIELQAEKARLDEAIVALERLAAGKVKRRTKYKTAAQPPDSTEEAAAEPQSQTAKATS